jgi:hypothetical protein
VKNVLAAGKATLVTREGKQDVVRPRMIHGAERAYGPCQSSSGRRLRILNVDDYMSLDDQN